MAELISNFEIGRKVKSNDKKLLKETKKLKKK
jgi:hypothetical protein